MQEPVTSMPPIPEDNLIPYSDLWDPTKGLNTMDMKPPTININGQAYTLRKLGIRDTIFLIRAAGKITAIGIALSDMRISPVTMDNVLLMDMAELYSFASPILAIPEVWEGFLEPWFASLIGQSVANFSDGDKFPPGSEIYILWALFRHPGFRAFLAVRGLISELPPLKELMLQAKEKIDAAKSQIGTKPGNETSTSSPLGMDGAESTLNISTLRSFNSQLRSQPDIDLRNIKMPGEEQPTSDGESTGQQ